MQTGVDPSDKLVDHEKRLSSDNTSLRLATASQNASNRGKALYRKTAAHSKYKGVTWHKKHKKWMAQIMCDRKKTHLGYFDCEIEAAKAYNSAALAAWGEFAGLNQLP
jgi:hypothetical protein